MASRTPIILIGVSLLLFAGPIALGFSLLDRGYDLPWLATIAGVGGVALSVSLAWSLAHFRALRRERRRRGRGNSALRRRRRDR